MQLFYHTPPSQQCPSVYFASLWREMKNLTLVMAMTRQNWMEAPTTRRFLDVFQNDSKLVWHGKAAPVGWFSFAVNVKLGSGNVNRGQIFGQHCNIWDVGVVFMGYRASRILDAGEPQGGTHLKVSAFDFTSWQQHSKTVSLMLRWIFSSTVMFSLSGICVNQDIMFST